AGQQAFDPLQSFDDWWINNIGDQSNGTRFGILCWLLWKNRNIQVFEGRTQGKDVILAKLKYWNDIVMQSFEAMNELRHVTRCRQKFQQVAWTPAKAPWMTLNIDGSIRNQGNFAAGGGLLRNKMGNAVFAFSRNMGKCSITRAELRATVDGLTLAWHHGARKVCLQVDSQCVVQLLSGESLEDHQHATLIASYRELIARGWEVRFEHIYR
ncbi:Putative ribonuclease H protein At1g65750, partial [Linum grandiflorum]